MSVRGGLLLVRGSSWTRVRPYLGSPIVTLVLAALLAGHLLALPRRGSDVGEIIHEALGFGRARATQHGGWSDCVLTLDASGSWQASEAIDPIPPGGYLMSFKVYRAKRGVFAPTSFVTTRALRVCDASYASATLPPAAVPAARAWVHNDVGAGPAFDQLMAGTRVTSRPILSGWLWNAVFAAQFSMLGVCAFAWATSPRPGPGRCRGCGYSTLGLFGGVCPECGGKLDVE